MIECRYCGEVYYAQPERLGARCRRCREPLYERREGARDANEPVPAGQCVTHPRAAATAACERCGALLCAVCRTRWNKRPHCPACVLRAVDEKEVRPEDVRAHRRQALFAVLLGACAWGLTLAAGLMLVLRGGPPTHGTLVTAGLLTVAAFLPSLFGIGQAAAAIRARGNRLRLATYGLALSASHVGVVFGLALLALWKS
jgi:hypothetical protein